MVLVSVLSRGISRKAASRVCFRMLSDKPEEKLSIDALLEMEKFAETPVEKTEGADNWLKPLVLGSRHLHGHRKIPLQESPETDRADALERKRQNMLRFRKSGDNADEFIVAIDTFKPQGQISMEELDQLVAELSRRHTVAQFRSYLMHKAGKAMAKNKKGLVLEIAQRVWGLDVQQNNLQRISKEHRQKRERIYFSDANQPFLLFRSPLIQLWKGAGAQIAPLTVVFASLDITATKKVISYVRSSWAAFVAKIVTKRVDFQQLLELYRQKNMELPLSQVQSGSAVHFKPLNEDASETFSKEEVTSGVQRLGDATQFEVSALKELHILELERKLLSYVTRDSRQSERVRNFFEDESKVYPSIGTDSWSLPWYLQSSKDYHRLKSSTERAGRTQLTEIDTTNYDKLESEVDTLKNTQSLFNKLPFMSESIQIPEEQSAAREPRELNFAPNVETIAKDLCDVRAPGDSLLTASFGKVLFADNGSPHFLENLQLLPSFAKNLETQGGFEYFLKLRFVPDPSVSVANFNEYPPIQATFQLALDNYQTDSYKVDITSLQIHSLEHESVVLCPVPGAKADVKFTSSTFMPVVSDFNVKQWTDEQPGILKFLHDSRIEFAVGENLELCYRKTPRMEVNIDGKAVPYVFTEDVFVKSLQLDYDGTPATLTVASGGDIKKNQLGMTLVCDDVETLVRRSTSLIESL